MSSPTAPARAPTTSTRAARARSCTRRGCPGAVGLGLGAVAAGGRCVLALAAGLGLALAILIAAWCLRRRAARRGRGSSRAARRARTGSSTTLVSAAFVLALRAAGLACSGR